MAATLALVFRARLRLLPLVVALAAAALTFGGLALAGASLTMASIAVLPVLIGLAVDYAIQLQSRVQEEERPGEPIAARASTAPPPRGAPTVATAAAATGAGFLVLLLSPVPMVRGFGAAARGRRSRSRWRARSRSGSRRCARPAGGTARRAGRAGRTGRRRPRRRRPRRPGACAARATSSPATASRARRAAARPAPAAARCARRRRTPAACSASRSSLAVLGWGARHADARRVRRPEARAAGPAARCATSTTLQRRPASAARSTSSSTSDDLTDPAVVAWMTRYQDARAQALRLQRASAAAARPSCARRSRCPDLFRGGGAPARSSRSTPCSTPSRRTSPRP